MADERQNWQPRPDGYYINLHRTIMGSMIYFAVSPDMRRLNMQAVDTLQEAEVLIETDKQRAGLEKVRDAH